MSFFHEIKRDGITSLHGIHEQITVLLGISGANGKLLVNMMSPLSE